MVTPSKASTSGMSGSFGVVSTPLALIKKSGV